MSDMTLDRRIYSLVTRAARMPENPWDELIHDGFASMAADVNNSGPHAQIEWLLAKGWTLDEIEKALPTEQR